MDATYAYDVLLGQMCEATTQEHVDAMLRDYRIYLRGMLEDKHSAADARPMIEPHLHSDVGWLLGELSADERARLVPMLPPEVKHPILGRTIERLSDEQLVAGGAKWAREGLPDA